jgi:lipid-binding SYLF domain-containing protein
MHTQRRLINQLLLSAAAGLCLSSLASPARAITASDLSTDANQTLAALVQTNPAAQTLSRKAHAVLIFPKIIKAGLVFGGSYGEGVLQEGGKVKGYYNSVSASWGWQAGAESYGYVVFLMSDKAVKHLHDTRGWELGVGPSVVVVNEGMAKNLSTSTLRDDAYAFIVDQSGLMASLSVEGTKISRIKTPD